jgi:hypothetical protein
MDMKELLKEWKKFLKGPEVSGEEIKFKTGKLKDLIQWYPGIKKLRVPSWYLQDRYAKPTDNDIACVVLEGFKPVAIAAIVEIQDFHNGEFFKVGVLTLFVDSWHREVGLAGGALNRVLEHSSKWPYIVGSRAGRKMLNKKNYKSADFQLNNFVDDETFINPYYSD